MSAPGSTRSGSTGKSDRTAGLRYGRYMSLLDRITINPAQMGGRPCIRGMRIRVRDVLDMLAEGATAETILSDFPDLEADDIRAAIAYAAREIDHPVVLAAK